MSYAVHVQYTGLLRTSSFDLWERLRELLEEQGLDPATSVVVDLFPDGGDREYGQVVTSEGRVYRFDLCYDRSHPHAVRRARLERWTDITASWQAEPLAGQTADAFIWAAPHIQTNLTVQADDDQTTAPTVPFNGVGHRVHSVVTAGSAGSFEPDGAEREVEIVLNHQPPGHRHRARTHQSGNRRT